MALSKELKERILELARGDEQVANEIMAEVDNAGLQSWIDNRDRRGTEVSPALKHTPKDPAVRQLAAMAMKALRARITINLEQPMTYEEIGDKMGGLTVERMRQLDQDLDPFGYEAEARARASGS